MKENKLPIQQMTKDDAETINAALILSYDLLYGENKMISSSDERCSKARLLHVLETFLPGFKNEVMNG